MDGKHIIKYFIQSVTFLCVAMVCINCIYGEDIKKNEENEKRVIDNREEAIVLKNKENEQLSVEIRSCKSLSLENCEIFRLEIKGAVLGDISIKDCVFENGINIAHGIVHGTLEINNCEFKNRVDVRNVKVDKDVILNSITIHAGIEIEELQATQMKMGNIINKDDESDVPINTSSDEIILYKTISLTEINLSSQLHFEDMKVPVIQIKNCTVDSCIIKIKEVDEIEMENMYVNKFSYIDFNPIPKYGIELLDSNLGQHVRLNLPYTVGNESKIGLNGTVANYDSLPSANDMLLMLQDESENRQTLAMLYRAYEKSGAPYDAKILRARMIEYDLDNCNWGEKPKLVFLYILTRRYAELYIFGLWCLGGFIGFVCMAVSQRISNKTQIILEGSGNDKIPSQGLRNTKLLTIMKNAAIASLEGMMPIQHIFGKHRCFGFSYFIYACLKIMSWAVIMLYVRAFTL
ncbi:MAG: hypothetical protein B6D35_09595 [Candidatus Brocadia sp. UTAMX2]|jgi:hypothetical protein|nr:MAG: hypothetical protein B6D35_09595 [Candidatus Brocadia sp. UTAMX2]